MCDALWYALTLFVKDVMKRFGWGDMGLHK